MIGVGLLMRLGLSQKLATLAAYAIAVLLVLGALWAYGQGRYNAGVRNTDAKWQLAQAKLEQQAKVAGEKADVPAAKRVQDYNAKVADEKERIDAAQESGSSPFDVLFGNAD